MSEGISVKLCEWCKLPHGQERSCVEAQSGAMSALLKQAGQPGECRGCKAPIIWVRHRNGKQVPYTPAGLNHFVDCPQRGNFR